MTEKKGSNIWMLSNACYVNLNIGKVFCIQDNVVKEFAFGKQKYAPRILELFLHEQGKRLTYDEIIKYAWGNKGKEPAITASDHDVHLHVGKLVAMGELAKHIKNNLMDGYTFVCPGLREIDSIPVLSQTSPMSYYEMLWKNHCRGIVRDQVATGNVRELIDFYVLPDITSTNGKIITAPFANLTSNIYVTAGSGFGKTTLLHIVLLTNIVEILAERHSNAVSKNSISKISEYVAAKRTLFGDIQSQYFPVFIYSSAANNSTYGSVLELAEGYTIPCFRDMVNNAHRSGTLLFLIDSIDEVESGEKLEAFISGAQTLLEEYPHAKVILTSRFLGRMQLPFECKTIHLAEMNDDAIQKMIKSVLSHRSAEELLELLNGFENNKYLYALARNPFMLLTMLEEKKEFQLQRILESIVNAIIERRWDAINDDISSENIKMVLGHLACSFVFNNLASVSQTDVEKAFYAVEKSLEQYKIDFNIPNENMNRFLRLLSCQSGILNVTYQNHIEKFVFQDRLVMCWLAAHYISRVLMDAVDAGIEDRNDEASIWSNAAWIDKFVRTFTRKRGSLSSDAIITLIIALVTCSEQSGDVLQKSILYYLLFKDAVSLSKDEKRCIAEGYQSIINNTFGENDIANHPQSDCRRLIDSAMRKHQNI